MTIRYLARFSIPISSHRTGTRSQLCRTVIQEFDTPEMAIARIEVPWRDIRAVYAEAVIHDDRPVAEGGGATRIAHRRNGGKLQRIKKN